MRVNVVRLDRWIDPCFDEILKADPAVALNILDPAKGWADVRRLLQVADIYHIPASRSDVPAQWLANRELLQQCPRLRAVSSSGAGYDTIDVNACNEAGVLVVNQSGGNANSVAEHTFGLMLDLIHRISESDRAIRAGSHAGREAFMGRELAGKVLGIVGIGHVGSRVAELAAAFRMEVLAFDPYVPDETVQARGATPVSMQALLSRSDIVSLHCPRNAETLGMFDREAYRQMKPGALFLTTARGGIHNESALHEALAAGHLAGAGLDVWSAEPPPADHPLLQLPHVIASYHIAGVTHEARRNMAAISARQILDLCHGRRPPRAINPQVCETALTALQAASDLP